MHWNESGQTKNVGHIGGENKKKNTAQKKKFFTNLILFAFYYTAKTYNN